MRAKVFKKGQNGQRLCDHDEQKKSASGEWNCCKEQTACREAGEKIIKSQVENLSGWKGGGSSLASLKRSRRESCQASHKFSLFCQLQFSTHALSPTATIRQLQSVAAGTGLEFTVLVRVTFFSSTNEFCGITGVESRSAWTLNRRLTIGRDSSRLSRP